MMCIDRDESSAGSKRICGFLSSWNVTSLFCSSFIFAHRAIPTVLVSTYSSTEIPTLLSANRLCLYNVSVSVPDEC